MTLLRLNRLTLWFTCVMLCELAFAQGRQVFTSTLPTGVRLDPAGVAIELGSMPMNLVLAPAGDKAVVVLSGWRE